MLSASPHYDKSTLFRRVRESDLDKQEAERDCYRQINTASLKAHAAVIHMASHQQVSPEQAKVLSLRNLPQCRGISCNGGRLPCRERCNVEMACTAGDEPATLWQRIRGWFYEAAGI